jgi:nucleoside-diphosphate-sugar epimerase/2-polyprenyl-3-methyl-5-hydroxy-6-metoxy-1,4-benzoquinol methylase
MLDINKTKNIKLSIKNKEKMKIVITGGLGYIGTELCKIYSGESRFKQITVLDSRFISERVKQIREWGIDFIQADILNKDILKKTLHDADIVFHLAGITDVAYTKNDENPEKDRLITEVGIFGTRNIIDSISENCKIIFPSTHVVYEGLKETQLDIQEDIAPCPVLTYSTGKVSSEQDLFNSNKNFIIMRLASVYGYSNDSMRIGIMPNLFSKIASQDGTIKLFSGGNQHKSMVSVIDVARAMKFLAESKYNKEIFHISKESMTVKDVAQLCKKINPKVDIIETKDEVPNLGYTISNKKLLDTGFKFLYDLESSIEEMISNWSKRDISNNLEVIFKGSKEYVDSRGKISNYELTEPINLVGMIESKAGSIRANHYHPIQEQKCLLISGEYISVIKDLNSPNSNVETRLIKAGDLSVIKPNVIHTMVFTKDSIFLNLVRGEREHENYGITHTIPYKLVDEQFAIDLVSNYKRECRVCGNKDLNDVLSLGMSPLANNLISDLAEKAEAFPLEMKFCNSCKNNQLSYVVPATKMFDNYLYRSSTTKSFRNHFEEAADHYISLFNLKENDLVVDIGSNDGVALKPFKERGIKVLGIEPAKNICEIANSFGLETLNSYFDDETTEEILSKYGNPSIITASNVFAHSDFLKDIANNVFKILKNDGCFIIEVQYLLDTIKDLTFDNIYHEHVNYWSVTSLKYFFESLGFQIFRVEHVNTHGGTIRVFIDKGLHEIDKSLNDFLKDEDSFGISNYETHLEFGKNVMNIKNESLKNITDLKQKYQTIVGYGAPAKSTTLLNYFGIDNTLLDYIVEDNELKIDKFIPGVNIPIKSREYFLNNLPEVVIVMAWNFIDEIRKNNQDLIEQGVIFLSIKDLQKSCDI